MDFEKLNDRYQEAKAYKDRWLALYQQLYNYVIPDRNALNVKFNYNDTGLPTTQQVWDNTAVLAAYQRANDQHSLMLPKDRVWGKLVMDPHLFSDEEIQSHKEDMDGINERIFFYLNESNLSRVVSSSFLDLVGGTGAVWVESVDDDTPIYFRSIPSVALYIEYTTDDVIETCWYQCKMTARSVLESFPDYNGDCYESLKGDPNEIWEVVYGQIRLADGKYYIYAFIEEDYTHPLWERESSYKQIIVFRDRVRPGEAEGRGIGMDLMPSIINLNRIVMYHQKSMAFKAEPVFFYDADKYFNPYSIRQWAGAMIARNPQGRNPLEALQVPEFPSVLQEIQDLRYFIQKGFQVDPLGEIDSPVKSATEVGIREQRAQRSSSTDMSRLINECPKEIFETAAKILSERKLLDIERSKQLNFNSRKFRFAFQSPLYDLQNQEYMQKLAMKNQFLQQFYGEGATLAATNMLELNPYLDELLNIPAKVSNSKEQVEKIMVNMQQLQQQAMLPNPATSAMQMQAPQGGVTI